MRTSRLHQRRGLSRAFLQRLQVGGRAHRVFAHLHGPSRAQPEECAHDRRVERMHAKLDVAAVAAVAGRESNLRLLRAPAGRFAGRGAGRAARPRTALAHCRRCRWHRLGRVPRRKDTHTGVAAASNRICSGTGRSRSAAARLTSVCKRSRLGARSSGAPGAGGAGRDRLAAQRLCRRALARDWGDGRAAQLL